MNNSTPLTLPELLVESSADHAGRPALSTVGGEPIRYEELEPRTRRIAALLRLLGARKGDRIALVSESRPEWGLACFGILRAGCIAVPILTDFSPEQMRNIVAHSGSRFVIVSKRLHKKLEGPLSDSAVLLLEEIAAPDAAGEPDRSSVDEAAAAFVPAETGADDVATIIYTSGTTGLSKGVMLTHRNILSNVEGSRRFIAMRKTDRFLSILPLAHVYEFTLGLITPLLYGSAVYYLDKPPSESALLPALAAVRPTILLSVPLVIEKLYRSRIKRALEAIPLYEYTILRGALSRIAGMKLARSFGGRIRFFGIGGAPLDPEVESFLKAARFPYSIGYGLTETAPLLAGNKPGRVKLHTTGLPTAGVELRIADMRPDTGEGEIQARGPNVTPGYYRDPARTAEIFTPDGWLKTGDLGVMDAEGRITVKGRLKTMILGASGENIYPEEIEAVLNSSPYVLESLVYGDETGLTALVQLKPEAENGFKESAVTRLGKAVGAAIAHAEESLQKAEEAAAYLVERIKREANSRLAVFSRLAMVKIQEEPFEKTPTQKIKRFLYPRRT